MLVSDMWLCAQAGLIAMETYMKGYGKARWLHGVTAQSALALVDRGYTFFTFVRDPLTRLRSAYSETLYHTLRKPDRNHLPGFAKMKPSVAHLRYFMKKLRCCRSKFVKEVYHADAQYLYIGLGVSVCPLHDLWPAPLLMNGCIAWGFSLCHHGRLALRYC